MLHNGRASAITPRFTDIDSYDSLASHKTAETVICSVCQATYRMACPPSKTRHGYIVLESAFLRVCHFCFRCQRPACPQCWNPVHYVCAACGEEAGLPFVSPVPSLEGLVFAPPVFSHLAQETDVPFICVRNGRFCSSDLPPHKIARAAEVPPVARPRDLAKVPSAPPALTYDHSYPAWLQEIMQHSVDSHVAEPPSPYIQQGNDEQEHTADQVTHEEDLKEAQDIDWPQWSQEARTSPPSTKQPLQESEQEDKNVVDTQPASAGEDVPLVERVESILIVILSGILLVLILMIVLALSLPGVNAFLLHLLHIDIRGEITYLLQSI
ncbi:MAG TPA: hypothetical protein VFV38_36125 [Ktedonobacteraceae bacterium]|nr:hypothetical protein [Ktedonobacteraceae bacterium]